MLAKASKNGKDILANRHISYTGTTKVALVGFPTVNMFGFFFCTPVPLRILAWSFVVPRSHFHPPKASTSYRFESSDNWPSHRHLPHKTDLELWSAVDRYRCFVKLSRSINFVPPKVHMSYTIAWCMCVNIYMYRYMITHTWLYLHICVDTRTHTGIYIYYLYIYIILNI